MGHAAYEHIAVSESGFIATIEVRRGPNNFIDTDMVAEIADALDEYDRTPEIRAIVLCAEGKHFCAGADFGSRGPDGVARFDRSGMLRLVAGAPKQRHVLTLITSDPGLQAYVFTFGP